MGTDNTFDISDYEDMFKEGETDNTEEAQQDEQKIVEVTPDEVETSTQEIQVLTIQEVNAHIQNVEVISIGVLVAVGLLVGVSLVKIFLDKLWR